MNITPYPQNAKKHPKTQVKLIAESIGMFGWQQPITVDENNIIIVGHGRWMAYQEYGENFNLDEPWITRNGQTVSGSQRNEPLSKVEVKQYRIMDNKIAESDWDDLLLHEEMLVLSDEGVKPAEVGFDDDVLTPPSDDLEDPSSSVGGNKEIDNDDLDSVSTITFRYEYEEYHQMLEDMENIKEAQGIETNEDLLVFLIKSNV